MARKKKTRSKLANQKRRRSKRKGFSGFAEFTGGMESLEARELLAGDVFEAIDATIGRADSAESSQELAAPVRGGDVSAVPASVITALSSHLNSTETRNFSASFKSLDVSGVSSDLLITVRKGNTNNNTITVQAMNASGAGTGHVVTYGIEEDGGSIDNLLVGKQGQKIKLVLEGKLDLLEVTKVADLQFAMGRKVTSASLLTSPSVVQVIQTSTGELGALEVGKSGDASTAELIIGADIYIGDLVKGTGYNGKLSLHYPDAGRSSGLVKAVDLSTPTPYVQGFGQLDGFTKSSFLEVKTGSGRQELRAGDETVSLFGGSKNDVLLGQDNAQTLEGEAGNDFLRAGDGDDTLRGGSDNDQLSGGKGSDTLEGGPGDDVYYFGEPNDDTENAWGTNDTITDTLGENSLDFADVSANLNVSINGDTVSVTATEEIDNDLPARLSYGSDTDAVELELANGVIPTVSVDASNEVVGVNGGTLAFRMILGEGRDQVSVTAPTVQEVKDELGEEATSTTTANVTVRSSPLGARITAGDEAIAYQDSGGFWQQTNELLLRNLLPQPERSDASLADDDASQVWTIPATTLTLSVGDFRNQTVSEYEASSFEVTLFGEPEWTGGFTGDYNSLRTALKSYYQNDVEPLIEAASSADAFAADPERLNEIAEELWLQKIADDVAAKFSVTSEVKAEVVVRDSTEYLSISVDGHVGDIAVAPTTVSLPATLASSFTATQSVSGTAAVSRFVAPSDNDAEVNYDINSLTRDLVIDFAGTQAKSTLDVSDVDKEMKITFTGPGELTVDVYEGATVNATIMATGISTLIVGNSDKTYVLTEAGGASQVTVTDSGTGERHLVLSEGFLDQTVVLNNDANAKVMTSCLAEPVTTR